MHRRTRQFVLWVALAPILSGQAAAGGSAQEASAPRAARDFPAHDAHQGVAIAAVPILDAPAAVAVFGATAAPTRAGFLPVELILSNQRPEAVRVELERIQLVTGEDKFEQADPEEIAWTLYPPPQPKRPIDSTPRASRIPRDKDRGKREEAEAALRSRQLRAGVLAPGAYARGYLYFDLRGRSLDLAHARLYIPTVVALPSQEPLLYFEIELKPYAKP